MAEAEAEGARSAGASVDIKRVPETAPLEVAKAAHFKLDQAAPIAADRGSRELRCDHRRRADALRPHVFANGEFPRSSGRPLVARRAQRQGRRRVHDRRPSTAARRRRCSRSSPICCTSAWRSSASTTARRPDAARRGDRRRPYGATTIAGGKGARQPSATELDGRAPSGPPDRRGREQAVRLRQIAPANYFAAAVLRSGTEAPCLIFSVLPPRSAGFC